MLLLILKQVKIKSIFKTAAPTQVSLASVFIECKFKCVTTDRKATIPLNKPDFQIAFKEKGNGDKNK